jgi:hypothetical protein
MLLIAVTQQTWTDGSGSGDYKLQINMDCRGSSTHLLLSNSRILRGTNFGEVYSQWTVLLFRVPEVLRGASQWLHIGLNAGRAF